MRPSPTILLERRTKGTYINEQIVDECELFAVFYKNKPMRIRTTAYAHDRIVYKRTTYTTRTYADKLADRLNDKFFTDEFTVVRLGAIEDE
jgi:hypothetical protein